MVTLLFTDIEGSTRRWAERGEAMSRALRRHDELIRAAIESHDGQVFKTVGDAFCAAFRRATDGVAAAVDAQQTLAAEDWGAVGGLPVRMALHSGTTEERSGDYFGPTLSRVARLLAAAHGGQVVVSEATAGLLHGAMPERSELRDLGEHRLKDFVELERVWQLVAPGLAETFPPLRSLQSLPNNLPRQLTPLVGREEVVGALVALVNEHPLVTLAGTGGVGKTRIALQVGADLLESLPDGVWFVELATLRDRSLVAGTIAAALGLREQPGRSPLETLQYYLKRKRLLLIVDNCEHVIDEAARIVDAILRSCPQVRLLATSREPLRIAGEHVYRVPSLAVPPPGESPSAEDALRYDAIALFARRAADCDATFQLTPENLPVVAEICRRLDGIALAIELAAARVPVLSPQRLARRLDERFRVLTGGSRTALPRQQTMRATIDWSYGLLSAPEQGLFRRLAIFAGGCTLETANAVCADEEVLDLLTALVDKSLVVAEPFGERKRYRMLESTRQYGLERLAESGNYETVANAHAEAYLALAEQLDAAFTAIPLRTWLELAEEELDNWRAALDCTLQKRADVTLGQRLAGALRLVWAARAPTEGLHWVREALKSVTESTPLSIVARLDLVEASLHVARGQLGEAIAAAQRALEEYRELGDRRGVADAQRIAGDGLVILGRIADGEGLLQAARAEYRALGDDRYVGIASGSLAAARRLADDVTAARALYAEALPICEATGAEQAAAMFMSNLAEIEFRDGNAAAAVRVGAEALAILRELDDRPSTAVGLSNTAAYLIALDDYRRARVYLREGLALATQEQMESLIACALQHLAAIAVLRPALEEGHTSTDYMRGARLLGFVERRLDELGWRREYTEREEYTRVVAALRESIGDSELDRLMTEGHAWSEDHAIAEGFAI